MMDKTWYANVNTPTDMSVSARMLERVKRARIVPKRKDS